MIAPRIEPAELLAGQALAEHVVGHQMLRHRLRHRLVLEAEIAQHLHRTLVGDVGARRVSQPYFVTRMCLTPYMPSSAAAVAPAGPLPTTSTSVSIGLLVIILSLVVSLVAIVIARPSSAGAPALRRASSGSRR